LTRGTWRPDEGISFGRNKQVINPILFPKHIEIKLADVLFFSMRKNLVLFKELGTANVHYSIFIRGSLIDFHETLEKQHKHTTLAEIEFDWQFLMGRIVQEMRHNWRSIFQAVKTVDPKWADLEVEYIPAQTLMEFLSPLMKGRRWNIDKNFLQELEDSIRCSRLGELTDFGVFVGTGSGYFVLSNGRDCVLFDVDRMSKIIERCFKLSITKVRLWNLTPKSFLGYLKMRLLVLNNSMVRYLRKL
jgi:hypothetical protein